MIVVNGDRPEPRWSLPAENSIFRGEFFDDLVMIEGVNLLRVHRLETGEPLWKLSFPSGFTAGPAGVGAGLSLVIAEDRRISVRLLRTGDVTWSETDVVRWRSYADAVVLIRCPGVFPGAANCTVESRDPLSGRAKWVHDTGSTAAGNLNLYVPSSVDSLYGTRFWISGGVMPRPAPAVLAYRLADKLRVLDRSDGRMLREYPAGPTDSVFALGGSVLRVRTEWAAGKCAYHVELRDPATDAAIVQSGDYDVGTVTGTACQQADSPLAVQQAVVVQWQDRSVALSTKDGAKLWIGERGERLELLSWPLAYGCTANRTGFVADLVDGVTYRPDGLSGCDPVHPVHVAGGVFETDLGQENLDVRTVFGKSVLRLADGWRYYPIALSDDWLLVWDFDGDRYSLYPLR